MTAGDPARRLLAEDRPTSKATTRTSSRGVCTTIARTRRRSQLFKVARESTAELLERMTAGRLVAGGDAQRGGTLHAGNLAEDLRRARPQHARQIRAARDAAQKTS